MARKFNDKTAYEGESLTGSFDAPSGTTAVKMRFAQTGKVLELDGTLNNDTGMWDVTATAEQLTGMTGRAAWYLFAWSDAGEKTMIANDTIYIRPIVSKYREMLEACEAALLNYANNPNKSVSVGELSITYKDRDDLLALISYYRSMAAADEAGKTATYGAPKILKVRFR